jgi:hypothetical protein
MLRGRQGFWSFVYAWAGIAVAMVLILLGVFWWSGSIFA